MLARVLLAVWISHFTVSAWAIESNDSYLRDVAESWSAPVELPATEQKAEKVDSDGLPTVTTEAFQQGDVTQTQMLAPQRSLSPRVAQRTRRSLRSASPTGRASVPFMIGDTGAGSCVSFGTLLNVDLGHPTLGCSRLNISEGNTPLPTDRVYFSYRHFQNSTPTRVFQFDDSMDIDRFLFGGERTFFNNMMSAEIRIPIEGRLSSDLETYVVNADSTIFAPPGFSPLSGIAGGNKRRTEMANISMIFKTLLHEDRNFSLSAGLGVTLPTAKDVTYATAIDEFVTFPEFPTLLARYSIRLDAVISNETFYLSPFLAWVYQPSSKWFHQGFMQVEVAANPSKLVTAGSGFSTFDTSGNGIVDPFDPFDTVLSWQTPSPVGVAYLKPQTLLRLNLGMGYVVSENQSADWIQKLTALFEVHYTTTLNDAAISSIPLTVSGPGFAGLDSIDLGNRNNRVDIVNLVAGLTANMGNWVVTNGVAAPLKTGSNRGYDFEYNLQIQRPF